MGEVRQLGLRRKRIDYEGEKGDEEAAGKKWRWNASWHFDPIANWLFAK